MGVSKEREAIKHHASQFPVQWGKRVDTMPDNQVIAIYLRLKAQGKL